MEQKTKQEKNWFDRYYKIMVFIPVTFLIICLIYLGFFYSQHGDFIFKDASLAGGTTITLTGDIDTAALEAGLRAQFNDISFRRLTDLRTGETVSFVIESSSTPDQIRPAIETIIGMPLTEENSSIEFTGPTLSQNFYRQLIIALFISFILMSIVIFLLFKTFVPSMAVIFAAFADIVIPLAILDFYGVKISAAGIAAFLMLIGYSVDTDILLTSRAIKSREGTVNSRIYGAFKTGILMTMTALLAVLPAFFIVSGLPDSFRQIFLILSLGLCADIINTWLTNTGIIKWYCESKGIK